MILQYNDFHGRKWTWDTSSPKNAIESDDGLSLTIDTEFPMQVWKRLSRKFKMMLMMAWIEYWRESGRF